jgi:uncharacterized protein
MAVWRSIALALILCWSSLAIADVAVPPLSGRVVDQTMTLSQSDQASLDKTLRDFESRKGSQVAVLIVPTTAPEAIEQYSIRVADAWKVGRKKIDDGAILVIAKDDHKLRIEVGYGLEGALTDVTSKRIIDEVIVPKFRTGDFAGGITDGVDRILKTIDGEPLPPPATEPQSSYFIDNLSDLAPFLFIGVIVMGGMLRAILGRLFGSLGTGIAVTMILWFVLGTLSVSLVIGLIAFLLTLFGDLAAAGRRGGGGFSTGGSFSGGSSGGFSGGGGSFGGGGASGSW